MVHITPLPLLCLMLPDTEWIAVRCTDEPLEECGAKSSKARGGFQLDNSSSAPSVRHTTNLPNAQHLLTPLLLNAIAQHPSTTD